MRFLYCLLLASSLRAGAAEAQGLLPTAADTLQPQPASVPFLKRPGVWRTAIPLSLIGLSYAGRNENFIDELKEEVREESRENYPRFRTHVDDYSRHAPLVAAYALQVVGLKGERGVIPFTITYGLSHALSTGIVSHLKKWTREPRPDVATDFSSFPSAHTTEAFLTATLLHEQYGRQYPWLSVAGYSVATATGAMRVLNDRHWVTDVVAGAGIGFLSAEAVWRLYPLVARWVPGKVGKLLVVMPTYAPGGAIGMVLAVRQ
ncbi:phosphatase PAP2 family protein [Hymenobacter jejuensis]|nr:phosphatase PAP2 family protein [Hymenobacter jejuensis]